jgi:O-antigen ligase
MAFLMLTATTHLAPAAPARPRVPGLFAPRTLLSDLCSFETVFLLFFFSNQFELILPELPFDLTIAFLGLSVMLGAVVILREGIYLPGLLVVTALLPWLAWVNASSMWTPSRIMVWEYLKLVDTVNLWCLIAGAMIIAHKRERMLRFLKVMIGFSVLIALLGIQIYLVYGSFKFAGWEEGPRVYNSWGRAAVNGAVILTVLALRSRLLSMHQILTGTLLGICVIFILLSSSRSALLAVATPCLLYLAVTFAPVGRAGLNMKLGAVLLPLALIGVAVILVTVINSGYRVDSVARMEKVIQQADDPDMVTGANRFAYYAAAIKLIIQSPFIGHGVRSFAPLYKHNEISGTHPHNIFLEILSDTGFIGFALFLLFLYIACRPLQLRRLRSDPMLLAVAMLFVSRFTAVQFGEDISGQPEVFVFIGLLALRAPEPEAQDRATRAGSYVPGAAARYAYGAARRRTST